MGTNCSLLGISPEEVEVIRLRGESEAPPRAIRQFQPSDEFREIPGYDVDLHREFYGLHLLAQPHRAPLRFLIEGDAGYPGGLDGNYSGDQHCLRYVSLPLVKTIAASLGSLSFAQFVEHAYAAFPPNHVMQKFRDSVNKLSPYYDELVSLYRRAAENDVALMVMVI